MVCRIDFCILIFALRQDANKTTKWVSAWRSQPIQIAKQNRTAGEPARATEAVLGTARLRGRDLAQRDEAQRGRWGCAAQA